MMKMNTMRKTTTHFVSHRMTRKNYIELRATCQATQKARSKKHFGLFNKTCPFGTGRAYITGCTSVKGQAPESAPRHT
jgi:hypothetical protein